MQTVNIHEAKIQFSHFVEQAATGEEIIIARAGKPVARLAPLETQTTRSRKLGLGKGKFTLPDGFEDMNSDVIQNMFESGV